MTIPELVQEVEAYVNADNLPELQTNNVKENIGTTPVAVLVSFVEAGYATQDLDEVGKDLVIKAATTCAKYRWHGMTLRGNEIAGSLLNPTADKPAIDDKYLEPIPNETPTQ